MNSDRGSMSAGFCCRKNRQNSVEYETIGDAYSEESTLLGNCVLGQRSASDELNLWSRPDDLTHAQSEDDRELSTLLAQRDEAGNATNYQMTINKVETIRTHRRKIQDRWKCVLRELGFEDEEALNKLVTVTSLSHTGGAHFSMKADNLHSAICRDTMIFGTDPSQRNRYATVLSRLLDLDIADDFFITAKKLYPRVDPELMSNMEWDQHPGDNAKNQQSDELELSLKSNNSAN